MNHRRPKNSLITLVTFFSLSVLPAANTHGASEDLLGCVHQSLGSGASWTADFNQTQHLALLSSPLQSSGRVEVNAGTIHWEMVSPIADVLMIDDQGKLTSSNGEPINHPVIANTIRLLLTLDIEGLKNTFKIAGTCAAGDWSLQLEPTDTVLAAVFSLIEIRGGATVDTVVLRTLNADFTEIRFQQPPPTAGG